MDEFEEIKKKIKKELEKGIEIDGSDIPVHERYAKEGHIKKARKKQDL